MRPNASRLANLGWAGIVLTLLFALFVKDRQRSISVESKENQSHEAQHLWHDNLLIIKNKQNWLLTGYGGLAFAPAMLPLSIQGLIRKADKPALL